MAFLVLIVWSCAMSSIAGAPSGGQKASELQCEPSKRPFYVEHPDYCDKFYICDDGEASEHWCDDGLVFDPKKDTCDLPHTVDCGERILLQDPKPSGQCPRRNGMFIVEGSCDQFSHCTDGQHTLIRCPPGIIFSPEVGTCVHPDQTSRPKCGANTVLDFECPNVASSSQPLRFGDHDRLAHPTSCRFFYMCLLSGMPRLGGCSVGLVFNPVNGRCDRPKHVPGCEDFYGEMDEDDEETDPLSFVELPEHPKAASRTSAANRVASQAKTAAKPAAVAQSNRFARTQPAAVEESQEELAQL